MLTSPAPNFAPQMPVFDRGSVQGKYIRFQWLAWKYAKPLNRTVWMGNAKPTLGMEILYGAVRNRRAISKPGYSITCTNQTH